MSLGIQRVNGRDSSSCRQSYVAMVKPADFGRHQDTAQPCDSAEDNVGEMALRPRVGLFSLHEADAETEAFGERENIRT
jgi:hypothetical protein